MTVLHNLISNKELKKHMLAETESRTTVSFYKYFKIKDPKLFRDTLYITLIKLKVFGRIYIAHEGINAQISVFSKLYEQFKFKIYNFHPALNNLRMNIALDDNGKSFWVLCIKVRNNIVFDGIKDNSFNPNNVGQYLNAMEVNAMLDDPEAIFVDMRNHYEYEIGHFDMSIRIPADTFRDQLLMVVDMLKEYQNKKIVMYCTGGIRCEKATAWMKHNGFKKVYHIEGGIIEYVHKARKHGLPVRFKGKNFVFDERMGERVSDDVLSNCYQCGAPSDKHTNCYNEACHVLFIQCIKCAKKYHNCCCSTCKKELALPLKKRIELFRNRHNYSKCFNKSHNFIHDKVIKANSN